MQAMGGTHTPSRATNARRWGRHQPSPRTRAKRTQASSRNGARARINKRLSKASVACNPIHAVRSLVPKAAINTNAARRPKHHCDSTWKHLGMTTTPCTNECAMRCRCNCRMCSRPERVSRVSSTEVPIAEQKTCRHPKRVGARGCRPDRPP